MTDATLSILPIAGQRIDSRMSFLKAAEPRDLYLAAACVHVCPGVVEVFEQHCIRHVPSFLSYLNQGPDFVAEVQQILREKLLTAPEEQLPKLADDSGRGALLMWVRAAAIRTALHQANRAEVRKRISAEEEERRSCMAYLGNPTGSD